MARARDPDLWQAWRERLRRFERSIETVADFCRRERVSVAAFYQWQRKLRANGDPPARSAPRREGVLPAAVARQASAAPRSQPQFVELVVPARPEPADASFHGEARPSAGCVEVQLPNGTCVRLASDDLAALRTAILTAAEIRGGVAVTGDASC